MIGHAMTNPKVSRKEIVSATRAKGRPPKGVPQAVLNELDQQQDDYILAWTRGLLAHVEKVDAKKASRHRRQN